MKLTVKQQRFADEYVICGNATEAAIKAGYSQKTAKQIGVENLSKPYLAEYIANRLEELQSEKVADQQEVLEYLTSVMRREHKESVVVTLTKEESKWVGGKKQTNKFDVPEVVEVPAKLSDANKAAELLGKRYAMWTDRQDVTQRTINIEIGEYDGD